MPPSSSCGCASGSRHERSPMPREEKTMPKLKTRKCAAKRVKKTGTGKFLYNRAGKRHLNTGKCNKRKRRLGQSRLLRSTEMNRVRSALPYA